MLILLMAYLHCLMLLCFIYPNVILYSGILTLDNGMILFTNNLWKHLHSFMMFLFVWIKLRILETMFGYKEDYVGTCDKWFHVLLLTYVIVLTSDLTRTINSMIYFEKHKSCAHFSNVYIHHWMVLLKYCGIRIKSR